MNKLVSETYNIHYLRMDDAQWEALRRVYEQLPEFIGYTVKPAEDGNEWL